jgi:uncharacterized damage-inducible protein DinB
MNKQEFLARCDYFDLVHGVTARAIAAFTDDELNFRPRPEIRTVRELVFHIYSQEQILAEAAKAGTFTMEAARASSPQDPAAGPIIGKLVSVQDARAYAGACHEAARRIFRELSEEELLREVESPFGKYPAWQYFAFAYDEHWHHRGQLYTYLRLLGKEPPDLYDYGAAEK